MIRKYFIILIFLFIASGCGGSETPIDTQGTALAQLEDTVVAMETQNAQMEVQLQEISTAAALATYVPYFSTQVMSLHLPPTPQGGASPTPAPLLPQPGMVYSAPDGLWLVDQEGQPFRLSERTNLRLSHDRRFGLYVQYDASYTNSDLWIVDLITGEERNLTNSPDRVELFGAWWPGNPDQVVLNYRAVTEEPEPSNGYLGMISLSTGSFQVLDGENIANGYPAPSPNGEKIAYDRGLTAWIYDLVDGPSLLDPAVYGITVSENLHLVSPAWSPDGTRMTWVVKNIRSEDDWLHNAIGIFDLEMGSAVLLHTYPPMGFGGQPPAARWSPDGEWVAYASLSEDDTNGIWVARKDGSDERFLGAGIHPVWSPDGSQLAFNRSGDVNSVWVVQVGEWAPVQVYLPPDARITAWHPLDQ